MLKLIIKEALRSLAASKIQTLLALLGIMIGVASVVSMISVGESAKEKSLEGLKALGTDLVTGSMQDTGAVRRVMDKEILKSEDVDRMARDNGFVVAAAPRINGFVSVGRDGKYSNSNAVGITSAFNSINKLEIKLGRKITDFDMERNYCVIGHDLAEQLFRNVSRDILGKTIYVKRNSFIVIGVYEKSKYVTFADNFNESVFIPLKKASLIFETKKLSNFKAKIAEGYSAEEAKRKIQDYFINRIKLMINVETQEMLIKQAEEQAKTSSNVLIATGAISLIVGGIGIMNLMLISIKERKREIGIRRSCGAQKSHIAFQFLSESVILSLIGGLTGVVAGIIVSLLIALVAKWKPIIPISSILISFAVSTLIGMIFGYLPSKRASDIQIIDALKMD